MLIIEFNHDGRPDTLTIRRFLTDSLVIMQNDAERRALPEGTRVREIIDLECPVDQAYLRRWNNQINPDQDWYKMLRAQRMTGVGNLQG